MSLEYCTLLEREKCFNQRSSFDSVYVLATNVPRVIARYIFSFFPFIFYVQTNKETESNWFISTQV